MGSRGESGTGANPKFQISNLRFQIPVLASNTPPVPFFERITEKSQRAADYGPMTPDN